MGFLDFLGLPDATVFFFFVLAIFKNPVYNNILLCNSLVHYIFSMTTVTVRT
jgi:hypothetical protein